MQDNNEIVNCKNVSIVYSLDDNTEYGSVFIVESSKVGRVVYDVICLLDRFELVSWGINTSVEYENIKGNCVSSESIQEYIVNDIDNAKGKKM